MNTGRYITVQVAGRQCLVDRNKLVSMFNVVLFVVCKKPTAIFSCFHYYHLPLAWIFLRVTNTNVPCIISPASNRRRRRSLNNSTKVIITFDGFSPAGPSGSFIFTADPTIIAIEPDKLYYG